MIETYANEDVTVKRKGEPNDANEPDTTEDTIKARVEGGGRIVRTKQGELYESRAVLYTGTKLSEGDIVILDDTDFPIAQVNPIKHLSGKVEMYEVIL